MMRRLAVLTYGVLAALGLAGVHAVQAQEGPVSAERRAASPPWFASVSMGYGQVNVASDQSPLHDQGTFTLAFRVGRALGEHLRLGFDLGGWLIEPADFNDPATGISVSETALVAQVFPIADGPLFVEFGGGLAHYTNSTPDGVDAGGTGWTIGAGWEHRLRTSDRKRWTDRVRVVPSVHYSGGAFRNTQNMLISRTGLRFDAVDVRVSGVVLFGQRR